MDLIIFCNGFGMDNTISKNIELPENCELMVLNSWHKLKNISIEKKYKKKYLIAWSMGVWASCFLFDNNDFDKKIAINGTPKGIDNSLGLNEKLFLLTLKSMSEQTKNIFLKNMTLENENMTLYSDRKIEDLKEELQYWWDNRNSYIETIKWDTAIISTYDKIVPAQNQINYWQKKDTSIKKLDLGHYIFHTIKTWEDIINL